jgi:hypothetical protein
MTERPAAITVDIRLIQEIEEATGMDCVPPPEVIAPLAARAMAHRFAWRNPWLDDELQDDIRKVVDSYGCILDLEEIHAVQQLRGWHRARYGTVTVPVRRLAAVRDMLGDLQHSLNDECRDTLEEFGLSRVTLASAVDLADREYPSFREARADVLASMAAGEDCCGECEWCWVRRLHIECAAILAAAGAAR